MGTRHLTVVYVDGQHKIAQYGQWDGYPTGQGATVLEFLKSADLKIFADKCRQTQWITKEEYENLWEPYGVKGQKWVSIDIGNKFDKKYPHLSRDTGAEILDLVLNATNGIKLLDSIKFAGDSLFCEWAYVIDLDRNTLEVYGGFQTEAPPNTERFADMPRDNDKYFPIKLAKVYPLDNLPTVETLNAECNPEEEE